MSANIAYVQSLYAAFGRGDVAFILDNLAADMRWTSNGNRATIPWGGAREGRPGAGEFFAALDKHLTFEAFEPKQFLDAGTHVVVRGRTRAAVKATRGVFDSEWVHIFALANGKVAGFEEYYDTAAIEAALRPQAKAA
jgi:uncharacterized protein